jgi:hypothetical protein
MRISFRYLTGAIALTLLAITASAGPIVFSGTDPGANDTDPRPNSIAAAASFDAAVLALSQTDNIITFESATLGAFTSLTVAPGVTLTGSDVGDGPQTIVNAPTGSPDSLFGYNTTASGSRFASFFGGTMTFTFATPVDAWGAYFTGVQLGGETITFNDGSSQTVGIPNVGSGAEFVGFTDAGQSISSITINVGGDIVGMDDVRYSGPGSGSSVPEPATFGLFGIALAGIGILRRRKMGA